VRVRHLVSDGDDTKLEEGRRRKEREKKEKENAVVLNGSSRRRLSSVSGIVSVCCCVQGRGGGGEVGRLVSKHLRIVDIYSLLIVKLEISEVVGIL
jgi:hypothetical protein